MISGSGRRLIDAAAPCKVVAAQTKRLQKAVSLISAQLGRDAEAKEAVVRLRELEPNFRISEWAARPRQ